MFFVTFSKFPIREEPHFGTTETILAKIWLVKYCECPHSLFITIISWQKMESIEVYRQCSPRAMKKWQKTKKKIRCVLCVPSTIRVVKLYRLRCDPNGILFWELISNSSTFGLKVLDKHSAKKPENENEKKKFSNADLIRNSNVRFAWKIDSILN